MKHKQEILDTMDQMYKHLDSLKTEGLTTSDRLYELSEELQTLYAMEPAEHPNMLYRIWLSAVDKFVLSPVYLLSDEPFEFSTNLMPEEIQSEYDTAYDDYWRQDDPATEDNRRARCVEIIHPQLRDLVIKFIPDLYVIGQGIQ